MLRGVNSRIRDFHSLAASKNLKELYLPFRAHTACKQYCLAAGATQGNIAYTQTVMRQLKRRHIANNKLTEKWNKNL